MFTTADEDGVPRAEVLQVAVHAAHHVRDRLAEGDDQAQELVRAGEERAVLGPP